VLNVKCEEGYSGIKIPGEYELYKTQPTHNESEGVAKQIQNNTPPHKLRGRIYVGRDVETRGMYCNDYLRLDIKNISHPPSVRLPTSTICS